MSRLSILFLSLFLTVGNVQATHFIGGELNYTCQGNGTYDFKLTVYRDCTDWDNTLEFELFAEFAIYEVRSQYARKLIHLFDRDSAIQITNVGFVDPPTYACLTPPDICVQKGEYHFSYTFKDLPSDATFYVIYESCCRNKATANVLAPADEFGATFFASINPEAQIGCNNSPVFNDLPPTVICSGDPFSFDHSAFDADGDSLSYKLTTPLDGGSEFLSDFSQDCFDFNGPPPCPPPFRQILYAANFTAENPITGSISIDEKSGMLTVLPQGLGQYVVNVEVTEYRDGKVIGTLNRDFQFLLADCQTNVDAAVQATEISVDSQFVVRQCGSTTVQFVNESTVDLNAGSFEWSIDLNGSIFTSSIKDLQLDFPAFGIYTGSLIVNPGLECSDTANILIEVFPEIDAAFEMIFDSCQYAEVLFDNRSFSNASGGIQTHRWSFGDSVFADLVDASHLYQKAGEYYVSLEVSDDNGCKDMHIDTLSYFPVPHAVDIGVNTYHACAPQLVFFENLSEPVTEDYRFIWSFGTSDTSHAFAPTYVYEDIGSYTVDLTIESPAGCVVSQSFRDIIEVLERPIAGFSLSSEIVKQEFDAVDILDESQFAEEVRYFIDGSIFRQRDLVHTFRDTGLIEVQQVVYHQNFCTDTLVSSIRVLPVATFVMPNAFTPNGDGINDLFLGKGLTASMRSFEMTIWSRWGELLFRTEDPEEGWNGSKNNAGEILPAGAYIYQVNYVDAMGEAKHLKGFATIVK